MPAEASAIPRSVPPIVSPTVDSRSIVPSLEWLFVLRRQFFHDRLIQRVALAAVLRARARCRPGAELCNHDPFGGIHVDRLAADAYGLERVILILTVRNPPLITVAADRVVIALIEPRSGERRRRRRCLDPALTDNPCSAQLSSPHRHQAEAAVVAKR